MRDPHIAEMPRLVRHPGDVGFFYVIAHDKTVAVGIVVNPGIDALPVIVVSYAGTDIVYAQIDGKPCMVLAVARAAYPG